MLLHTSLLHQASLTPPPSGQVLASRPIKVVVGLFVNSVNVESCEGGGGKEKGGAGCKKMV